MKHLNKDIILNILESNEMDNLTKNHLDSCDKCFLEYASFKGEFLEIKNAKFQKTPKPYMNYIYKKFNLEQEKSNHFLDNLLDKINKVFKTIAYKTQIISTTTEVIASSLSIKRTSVPYIAITATFSLLFLIVQYLPQNQESLYFDFTSSNQFSNTPNIVQPTVDRQNNIKKNSQEKIDSKFPSSNLNNNIFSLSLNNMEQENIIDFAKNNQLKLMITYGDKFLQKPKNGEYFNPKEDTLKITLPRSSSH